MKMVKKKVNKPISLAGCIDIFNQAGITEETYSQWGVHQIFNEAEKIAKSQNICCEEIRFE